MKHVLLTTLMAFAFGGTAALAAPGPGYPPLGPMDGPHGHHGDSAMMFEHMDANGDGVITLDETKAQRAKMFERLDRNGDGYLQPEEDHLARQKHRMMGKMHRAESRVDRHLTMDTNKDGKISLSEFAARPSPLFDRLDQNGDGAISADERVQANRKAFARMDVNGDGFLSPDDHKAQREKMKAKMQARKAQIDTDKDGKVSKAEFVEAKGPMWEKLDQNHDGKLTREEMDAAHHDHAYGRP